MGCACAAWRKLTAEAARHSPAETDADRRGKLTAGTARHGPVGAQAAAARTKNSLHIAFASLRYRGYNSAKKRGATGEKDGSGFGAADGSGSWRLVRLVIMMSRAAPSVSAGEESLEPSGQATPEATAVRSGRKFCGIAFGTSRDAVLKEKQEDIVDDYTNAVAAKPISVYGCRMQPTFWFNAAGLLMSGSYEMVSEDYDAVTKKLKDGLTADYGTPAEASWYDYNDQPVAFSSSAEAKAAVEDGSVFYCVTYDSPDGLKVELYVQGAESGGYYEFYIYYTDPDFMD